MYSTLPEYVSDIQKVISILSLSNSIKEFPSHDADEANEIHIEFIRHAKNIHDLSKKNHSNLLILNGTLLLFMAGRFEKFVRSTFEELCTNTVDKAEKFRYLPREMRENLVKFTAEVISNPKKYGHNDNSIRKIVNILSENLVDSKDLSEVNYSCISVTSENMRSVILSDLFKRIGVKTIWEKISQQAKIQTFFETHDAAQARKKAEAYLDEIMEQRNNIAHPSSSITWPNSEYVNNSAEFLIRLGNALVESLEAIEFELQSKISEIKSRSS